jgi:ATP-dependent exoDNAse (exonuclease V) alpha subunit
VVETEVGNFVQYPLQLGYALTIHKAQGKTLDRVIVDIDRGAFAHGQLYVALSRTRNKKDMLIKSRLTEDDIIFSYRIKSFLA